MKISDEDMFGFLTSIVNSYLPNGAKILFKATKN